MRRCFLLLVDGLRPDIAERLLEEGRLPHLTAMVREGGGGITRAVTSFPSTTTVSYLPFLTGCIVINASLEETETEQYVEVKYARGRTYFSATSRARSW